MTRTAVGDKSESTPADATTSRCPPVRPFLPNHPPALFSQTDSNPQLIENKLPPWIALGSPLPAAPRPLNFFPHPFEPPLETKQRQLHRPANPHSLPGPQL